MATAVKDWYAVEAVEIPPADPAALVPTPDHVPPELIRPFPFILGATTTLRPHSLVAPYHDGPEVFWAERVYAGVRGAWVPRTIELMQQVYSDNLNFKARGMAPFAQLIGENWYVTPQEADPPEHPELRSLVNPVFSPKRMAALEEKIRVYARDYIRAFKDKGGCEFMSEFAFEFPIKVFLELMGLPQDRVAQFLAWEHTLLHEADLAKVAEGTRAVVTYLRSEIDARRTDPRDDLISYGLSADNRGRKFSEDELLGFCVNLFLGGLDTVSTSLAWHFLHLAEHPEDQAKLRADAAAIPAAIDEIMRYYGPVATGRECVNETRLGNVTVKPGDKVFLATYIGGHDPNAFDQPEEIRLDRAPRHVSFGYGHHLCVGMHLARREIRIALEEAFRELPTWRLAPGAEVPCYLASIVQPMRLPLVWDV
jgi:cytochrome P450